MEIRRAIENDVLQLSELFKQETEYHRNLADYYELIPEFDWMSYTKKKLKGRNRIIFVAEDGEKLAGFIAAIINDFPPASHYKSIIHRIIHYIKQTPPLPVKYFRRGIIEDCFVIPSLRKQGIGRRLVSYSMKWFQSMRVSRVELSLIAGNNEGDAFWNKSGFKTYRTSLYKNI